MRRRQAVQPVRPEPVLLPERAESAALQHAIVDPAQARPADILALQRAVWPSIQPGVHG